MICKSWQYPSHPSIQFPSSAFPLLLLFLLSRATSRLVPCIMHTSSLSLSLLSTLLAISKKGTKETYATSTRPLSREVDRLRNEATAQTHVEPFSRMTMHQCFTGITSPDVSISGSQLFIGRASSRCLLLFFLSCYRSGPLGDRSGNVWEIIRRDNYLIIKKQGEKRIIVSWRKETTVRNETERKIFWEKTKFLIFLIECRFSRINHFSRSLFPRNYNNNSGEILNRLYAVWSSKKDEFEFTSLDRIIEKLLFSNVSPNLQRWGGYWKTSVIARQESETISFLMPLI